MAAAKGKLSLTGFSEFNGKYVYSALVTTSGKALIGMKKAELNGGTARISMVQIHDEGNADIPLYTATAGGTTIANIYDAYEGSEEFSVVSILIVDDADGAFTAADAASFASGYAGSISNNPSNIGFTPQTSGGNITISRDDAKTMAEITAGQSAEYILVNNIGGSSSWQRQ
ncbi:MAG: hypothetical protein LBU28_11175 [Spirochaetaceae bacterium]|nr:hypothetical protein [Spirochaetaceae bacterium]